MNVSPVRPAKGAVAVSYLVGGLGNEDAFGSSSIGLAAVEGLPDGVPVTPSATKPGCTLTSVVDGFTGRVVPKKGFAVEHLFRLSK
jgi:hypothetical protein